MSRCIQGQTGRAAVCKLTLSATTSQKKNYEYIVETAVRSADRFSAEAYMHRAAFKGKLTTQLRVSSKSSRRYKRLGH